MASRRTELTEIGTALGIFWDPNADWPRSVERIDVPGIPHEIWRPVVDESLRTGAPTKDLLLGALMNGRAFRQQVLGDRRPRLVEWTGRDRATWKSDIPFDVIVDHVYFIQAKHDSTCVLNTSPYSVFELLTAETHQAQHQSWYVEIAPLELEAYYGAVRQATAPGQLPPSVGDLDRSHRALLKVLMRERTESPSDEEHEHYGLLNRAVSTRTADRWTSRLAHATASQRTRLLLRMLRITGGPYWLLGTKGNDPLRLEVIDTRRWRQRYELKSFLADAADVGQAQVNWRAEVVDRASRDTTTVRGFCEIRWSHGKLQGAPECKVQVTTPLDEIPGYDAMT